MLVKVPKCCNDFCGYSFICSCIKCSFRCYHAFRVWDVGKKRLYVHLTTYVSSGTLSISLILLRKLFVSFTNDGLFSHKGLWMVIKVIEHFRCQTVDWTYDWSSKNTLFAYFWLSVELINLKCFESAYGLIN